MGTIIDHCYEEDEERFASQKKEKKKDAKEAAKMSIRDYATGFVHQVRSILITDGITHVWTQTWKGMHIIGQDCEFVKHC